MPKKGGNKRPKPQEADFHKLYGKIYYCHLSMLPNITSFLGLIDGMSQEKGYAYASIQYYADFFGVHTDTIRKWSKELVKQGIINITSKAGKCSEIRIITPSKDTTSSKDTTPSKDTQIPPRKVSSQTSILTSVNNNIYANGICVNASCDDVQNNDTQNAKEAPTQKEASDTLELLFAEWYSSYPRKKDKQRAKKAFLKVMKLTVKNEKEAFGEYAGKPPAEKVAMMKQIATRQAEGKDTQYIPYPSTWLNGYRWQDETTNTAPTANTDIYTELYADEADNIPIQDI